jgi:uncharacterized membrane protein (DUF106 family)
MKKMYKAIFFTAGAFLIVGCLVMALGSFLHNYHKAVFVFIMAIIFATSALILYQFFEDQEKAAEREDVKKITDKINKIPKG